MRTGHRVHMRRRSSGTRTRSSCSIPIRCSGRAHGASSGGTRSGDFRDVETELTTKYGSVRTVSWSSLSATYPVDGWDVWAVGVDRTEARRNERSSRSWPRSTAGSSSASLSARSTPSSAEPVADVFRFALVSIGQRQPDGTVRMSGIAGPNAPGRLRPGDPLGPSPPPRGGSPARRSGRGSSRGSRPSADSSFGVAWRNRDAGRKIGASIALPLAARGAVLGALTVHAARPDAFDARTVDLLLRLTQQVSLSLDHAAGLTEIRLQSLALDAVRHSVVITARDGTIEWVNPAFTAMTGLHAGGGGRQDAPDPEVGPPRLRSSSRSSGRRSSRAGPGRARRRTAARTARSTSRTRRSPP